MLRTAEPRAALTIRAAPATLVLAVVGLQICYPLLGGQQRARVTVATVIVFAAASLTHAWLTRGVSMACVLGAVAIIGFTAELIGSHTGVPFGDYTYAPTLGARLWGVPLLIGLGWLMMAWPAALVARRLTRGPASRIVVGAWALASWDLFLDPQMVDAGHWTWSDPNPHLPGVDTVPVSNLLGWVLVAVAVSALLQRALDAHPRRPNTGDGWMFGLYLWTYASSVLALGVFLHLPWAALWGAVGMGVVAVPLAARLRTR